MQLALARDRLAVFEVAKAGALHCADDRLPTPCGGDAQIFTQVEATATTQRTGAVKVQRGFCRLQICAVNYAVSPGDNSTGKINQVHGESF